MKNTKKALLSSALALFMCFAMLLGTTFAWFTDSVTSANNIIKSGNLNVEMYYADGSKAAPAKGSADWTNANGATIYSADQLWEPGYTDAKHIMVANEGTLALKWQLAIIPTGDVSELAEVIDVYYTVGATAATRDNLGTRVGTLADIINRGIAAGELSADEAYTATIVLKMQESAGNEYQNKTIGNGFTIQLLATQLADESDSFGSDYDKDAVYAEAYAADAAGLIEAIETIATSGKSGTVALTGDIVLSDSLARAVASQYNIAIAKGADVTINLNGNNITKVTSNSDINGDGKITTADNHGIFQVKGNLTVIGNGTISAEDKGTNMEWNALTTIFSVEGGTLTLGEGVTAIHKGGSDMAYVVDVNTTVGTSTLNVDGAVLYSTYVGARIFNNSKTAKGIINYNSGIISGDSRDVWAHHSSSTAPVANAVVNTTFNYTTNDAGDRYYFSESAAATDYAGLKTALTDGASKVDMMGNTVNLNYGLTKAMIPAGSTVTIANAVVSGKSYGNAADGTVIFENCTFTNTGAYSIHFDAGSGDVIFKNCELYGWNSFGAGLNSVSFYDCALYGNGTYALIRSYVDLYVENCYIDTTKANHTDNYSEGVEAVSGATLTEKNNTYVATTLSEVMALAKKGNTTIDAQGANLGDFDYNGTFANGTVLKNAKFTYVYGASVDGIATFENCEFVSDHSYCANFSDGSYTGKVVFNNCYFDGWSSFGDAITSVEMNNCTFDRVISPEGYGVLRFYQNAEVNNCVFNTAFDGIDTNKTGTVVNLNNCKGIDGKIYNNGSCNGTWIVDGVTLTDVPSW